MTRKTLVGLQKLYLQVCQWNGWTLKQLSKLESQFGRDTVDNLIQLRVNEGSYDKTADDFKPALREITEVYQDLEKKNPEWSMIQLSNEANRIYEAQQRDRDG